jgi:hypothetical protein
MAQGFKGEPGIDVLATNEIIGRSRLTFLVDCGAGDFEVAIPSKVLDQFDPREAIPKALEATAEALLEHAKCLRGRK